MQPNRKQIITDHLIEEFYWNGKYVVYIDHKLVPGNAGFKAVCNRVSANQALDLTSKSIGKSA